MARAWTDKIEDIPESLRGEYEPGPGGKFYLKIDGLEPDVDHPAVKPLREAHARSKSERAAALEEAKQVKAALEALRAEHTAALESVVPKAQMDALRRSYEETGATKLAEKQKEIDRLNLGLRDVLVNKEAQALALSLAADPMYADHYMAAIVPRLSVEYDQDGKARTRVLDRAGQPSALTLDGLRDEISQDPRFKPLNKGSQASGGGAVGASGGGGATGAQKPNFLTASPAEIDAWLERNKHQPGS